MREMEHQLKTSQVPHWAHIPPASRGPTPFFPPPLTLTPSPSNHLTLSPSHLLTLSPYHPLNLSTSQVSPSQPFNLSKSHPPHPPHTLSHPLTPSHPLSHPPHPPHPPLTPSHPLTLSPSHPLTLSPPLTPSHPLSPPLSPSHPHPLTPSLTLSPPLTPSHLLTSQDHISRITAQQAMLYEEHCKLKSEHQPATEVVVNNVQVSRMSRTMEGCIR